MPATLSLTVLVHVRLEQTFLETYIPIIMALGKILASIVLGGGQVVVRAFTEAYRKAAAGTHATCFDGLVLFAHFGAIGAGRGAAPSAANATKAASAAVAKTGMTLEVDH